MYIINCAEVEFLYLLDVLLIFLYICTYVCTCVCLVEVGGELLKMLMASNRNQSLAAGPSWG